MKPEFDEPAFIRYADPKRMTRTEERQIEVFKNVYSGERGKFIKRALKSDRKLHRLISRIISRETKNPTPLPVIARSKQVVFRSHTSRLFKSGGFHLPVPSPQPTTKPPTPPRMPERRRTLVEDILNIPM